MRTLSRAVAVWGAVFTAVTLPARAARAQAATFALDRFDPSERGSDWFAGDSLDFRGHLRPAVGLVGSWAYRPLVLKNSDDSVANDLVRNQVVLHAGASLVLVDRLRLAVDVPVQIYANGDRAVIDGATYPAPSSTTAMGDIRLAADGRLFGRYRDPISAALGVGVYIPSGKQDAYASDGKVRVAPHAMLAGDIGLFAYAVKLGSELRSRQSYAGTSVGSNLFFTASAGVRLVDGHLLLGPEIFGSSTVVDSDFGSERSSPLEALLGGHYAFDAGFRLGAGISAGLNGGFGSPTTRGLLSLEWMAPAAPRDRDKDGIPDAQDACPNQPGRPSANPEENGCPAPPDADSDGIPDAQDACPHEPGPASGDRARNGCPPPKDSDGDGIVDAQDACPMVAGPPSDDPKKNGCPPPPDRDKDGVLDEVDACPDVAGIASADPKLNGCPDPDRDKDGVANDQDACPDTAGPADPDPKRNGCPKAFVQAGQIKILDQVKFKTNSAAIAPGKDSEDVLNAVKQVLTEHPEIKMAVVEGHTDSKGSAARNRKLSAQRAASVVKWLVAHGVAPGRLSSQGFGPDRPVDSNDTEEGRHNNRRVEFRIEDRPEP